MDRYEEALKRAKQGKPIEEVFPEIGEERIQELLRSCVCRAINDQNISYDTRDEISRKVIPYLEKQKGQKPADKLIAEIERTRQEMVDKGEQYGLHDAEIIRRTVISTCEDLLNFAAFLQKEQKPAEWSEEDEERLNSIIESYKELVRDYKACHDVDYIPYNSNTVIRNVVDDVNFLKSLRPNHWKPSEEQMSYLLAVLNEPNNAGSESCHLVLKKLYDDLKRL